MLSIARRTREEDAVASSFLVEETIVVTENLIGDGHARQIAADKPGLDLDILNPRDECQQY